MAGLVPAIHVLLTKLNKEDVDARHEAGMTAERPAQVNKKML
jgi:hypothetical protein